MMTVNRSNDNTIVGMFASERQVRFRAFALACNWKLSSHACPANTTRTTVPIPLTMNAFGVRHSSASVVIDDTRSSK